MQLSQPVFLKVFWFNEALLKLWDFQVGNQIAFTMTTFNKAETKNVALHASKPGAQQGFMGIFGNLQSKYSQDLTHSLCDERKKTQMLPLPSLHNGFEIKEL